MIWMALATAVGIFIIMWRIDITKFTGYLWQSEMALFILLIVIFMGTFSGMMTGLIAGIFLSVFLQIAKAIKGAKKLVRTGKFVSWKNQT